MYIWRKHATEEWIKRQNEDLQGRFASALAIVERPGKTRTLVEVSCDTWNQARQLRDEFGGAVEKLRADWLQQLAKKTRAKPLRIGSRLIVNRAPSSKSKGTRTIVIPAEAAFGTGEHATTAMCLRMLERVTRGRPSDWSVLDAGTGSGILAIAASCFGASRILAIDNDPLACSIAARNARANKVDNVEFRMGSVLNQKLRGKFDIITANLFSEILIAVLPRWRQRLAKDGSLILSGVLRSQEKAVARALARAAFSVGEIRRRGKWIAILCRPSPLSSPSGRGIKKARSGGRKFLLPKGEG
jgi:ribosomal protein L11 methyltransferase